MKLLLDTHIWVWSVSLPERISKRVAQELRATESELWLSPISVWEITILNQRGRIELAEGLEQWTTRALRALPLNEALLTHEVAREVSRLRLPHRDPADHFLVATAKVFDLTLVTADERLMNTPDIAVLANR